MVTIPIDELPAALKRLAELATKVGWTVGATEAHVDVDTVAVRFTHETYRAYGVWTLGTTPTGKPSAKWRAGAARHGRYFPNLDDLRTYLGIAK